MKDNTDIVGSVMAECKALGNTIALPGRKLGREEYLAVKKRLESYGGKWKGGKTCAFVFDTDDASGILEEASCTDARKKYQFYETPEWIADMMAEDLYIQPDDRVLEPSAGKGRLINAVHRLQPDTVVDCYEMMATNRKELGKLRNVRILGDDFMEREDREEYDAIIANPPFRRNQDIRHVMKMYGNLKEGGRMAIITGTHWTYAQDRESRDFREWINGKCTHRTELQNGQFRESGTDIGTVYMVIRKPTNHEEGTGKK